jgi:hypothetical protein
MGLIGVVLFALLVANVYGAVVFYRHKRQWRYKTNGFCPCRFCKWARTP